MTLDFKGGPRRFFESLQSYSILDSNHHKKMSKLLLVCLIVGILFAVVAVDASTPTCRSPTSGGSNMKVGVVLSHDELEDMVDSEIMEHALTMMSEVHTQGRALSDEDLELLNELSDGNTLFLRRLGRRLRRLGRRLGRGLRRIGRGIGRIARGIGRVVKKVARAVVKAIKALVKALGFSKKARVIIENSVSKWNGKTGPYHQTVTNRAPFVSGEKKECVACRVDCMKHYSGLRGAIFTGCKDRYHYYGCQAVAPCFTPSSASDSEVEGMVGICIFRNGCNLRADFFGLGPNTPQLQRLLGGVRSSGVTNPE